jgi:alpha/beta superfamily hydrolase
MAIEPVQLHTADGLTLEGELRVPDAVRAAAVLAHPHPLHGGNMRSIVVGALFTGLAGAGVAALRFNFRGVGESEGVHDGGRGERLDVVAALDALDAVVAGPGREQGRGLPLVLAGWSFGADTLLAVDDERHAGWFAIAPPLRRTAQFGDSDVAAANDPRPKLLAVPQRDQFRSPESARQVVASWTNTRIHVVPGADHFLVGRTDRVVELAVEFVRGVCDTAFE